MANEYLTTSDAGLDFIIKMEASIPGIYNDFKGYATFGVGHLLHADKMSSLLLAAAKASDTFKPMVLNYKGVKYLTSSAAFHPQFAELKASAVKLASGVSNAQARVDLEAQFLARTPTDVFKQDLVPREQAVRRMVLVNLVQCEFDALISFQFNTNGLHSSGLLKSINKAGYRAFWGSPANPTVLARQTAIADIEAQFEKWNKADGQFSQGLFNRRKAEATNFLHEARDEQLYYMTHLPPAYPARPGVPLGKSPSILGPLR
ncbi:MAG TPA: lysozyme [Polyangiaceae bacterium]